MPPSLLPTGVAIWLPVSSPITSPRAKDVGHVRAQAFVHEDLTLLANLDAGFLNGNGVGIWPTPRGDQQLLSTEVAPLIFQLSSDNGAIVLLANRFYEDVVNSPGCPLP